MKLEAGKLGIPRITLFNTKGKILYLLKKLLIDLFD